MEARNVFQQYSARWGIHVHVHKKHNPSPESMIVRIQEIGRSGRGWVTS